MGSWPYPLDEHIFAFFHAPLVAVRVSDGFDGFGGAGLFTEAAIIALAEIDLIPVDAGQTFMGGRVHIRIKRNAGCGAGFDTEIAGRAGIFVKN
jgi:hypothetical protein